MKAFLDQDFLLKTETAKRLFHDFAADMPIIDYHCHLSPKDISEDRIFNNLSEVWLHGDHYKWRAMRTNGIDEGYCTGEKSDLEKFQQWAATVPYTMRNPLYHWTHMELQRYFNINEPLSPQNATAVYEHCSALLRTKEFSVRNLLRKMKVELVCTTDDPVDTLEYHKAMMEEGTDIKMVPAFRPDMAMNVNSTVAFLHYVQKLVAASGMAIASFADYLAALKSRHDFFATMGCQVSDHGLEEMYADGYTDDEIHVIFDRLLKGEELCLKCQRQFKSAMLVYFAEWDHEKGWVQQFHLGALRGNNSRMLAQVGPDTGWDSIGTFDQAKSLSAFLNGLDSRNKLTKTILYNLNPADNEVMATMVGNFNDGSVAGKIQFGSGWWFLDQKDGIIKQLNTLSNMGLLSRFVGMLTDSRSFLSFPRHEYFRRILCDLIGTEVEEGELPNDIEWLGKMVQDISYNNNVNYFNWKP